MKFLFGQVHVGVSVINAENVEDATQNFKTPPEHRTTAQRETLEKIEFFMPWNEFPGDNPVVQRDQVLASFLVLMQNKIPFTPDAPPSAIIVPPGALMQETAKGDFDADTTTAHTPVPVAPPGSLTVTEETKIDDHESDV